MHHHGGLYLDIDVKCLSSTDSLLSGNEVVLQLEDTNPKSLNNAVMASVPRHPFWLEVMRIMMERGSSANNNFWAFMEFRDLHSILKTTGVLLIHLT